jgi:hypothetical protein
VANRLGLASARNAPETPPQCGSNPPNPANTFNAAVDPQPGRAAGSGRTQKRADPPPRLLLLARRSGRASAQDRRRPCRPIVWRPEFCRGRLHLQSTGRGCSYLHLWTRTQRSGLLCGQGEQPKDRATYCSAAVGQCAGSPFSRGKPLESARHPPRATPFTSLTVGVRRALWRVR